MNYTPDSQKERRGIGRLAAIVLTLCLTVLAAAFFSGNLGKQGTSQPGQGLGATSAQAAGNSLYAFDPNAIPAGGTGTTTPNVTVTASLTAVPSVTVTLGTGTPGTGTPATGTGTPVTGTPGTGTPGTGTPGTGTPVTGTPGTGTPGTGTPGTGTPGTGTPGTGTPVPGCQPIADVAISIVPGGGFVPPSITVNPGTRVTWTNNSGSRARVRDINHVLFDSGDLEPGQSFSYIFCNPGTYQYENQRAGTTGVVIVLGGTPGTGTPGTGTPGTGTPVTGTPGTGTPGTGTPGTGTPGTGTPGTGTPGTGTPATGTRTPGTGTPGTGTPGTSTPATGTPGTGTPATGTRTPGTGTPQATTTACLVRFADVPPAHTFYSFIRCLACRGIISGYPCGGTGEPCNTNQDPYFRPGNLITRGQLAKIVAQSAGFSDPHSEQTFEDVLPGTAFHIYIERLASRGVMGGYPCGQVDSEPCVPPANRPYFRPGNNATRGQLTKIVAGAAGFNDPAPTTFTFTDVEVGSTFHVYVERLLMNRPGVMEGYPCGGPGEPCDDQDRPYFRPNNPLTRGQASKIVANTFFPNCQTP
jgi:hypothetical protein